MLVAAIAVGGLAAWPRGLVTDAVAGDPKIADTLFKSGKQALSKGDSAGAVSYFKKALEENPDLIEACWWCASAQEKGGDKGAALSSYRQYVTLFEGKGPAASKEEQRLKALADKSIAQLAAGELEFRKLEDAYVAALLTFAKDNFVRDPGVSRRAVEALLAVRSDHEEAKKLLEKLGGGPAEPEEKGASKAAPGPATGPFAKVKEWRDLLKEQALHSEKVISYEEGVMVVDTKGGSKVTPNNPIEMGDSFAYEMEFHVLQTYERGWFTALVFADKGEETFLTAFAGASRVVLLQNLSGSQTEVAAFDMPSLDLEKWHRLGVLVKGPQAEVWFDGKKVLTWREPGGGELGGALGFIQQRCKTERRVYRAGKVD
jgi:tetratricopeptide (TPR) repeat protein